ncbi:helix-turn-helix domain-containing protein [Cylindrospermum sp. FACHB-282]|uniref:helix-turn-helix domain-containing protein n=1 Tax=Cylindrospermum sp. FACHB-282 TaxID=2692794 RepID=UPI0035CD0B19
MTIRLLVVRQPEIGRLIRELHTLTVLTQERFAAHIGITYPTINHWENSHFQPSPLAMEKKSCGTWVHRDKIYSRNTPISRGISARGMFANC